MFSWQEVNVFVVSIYFVVLNNIELNQCPILGERLIEIIEATLAIRGRSAYEIFGSVDEKKVLACATLFAHVAPLPTKSVFERLICKYYANKPDSKTLHYIGYKQKLNDAAINGELAVVMELVDDPIFDPNDFQTRLTLVRAASRGRYEIVLLLLKKGVDPNSEDSIGVTAIMAAVNDEHVLVANLLSWWGADPYKGYGGCCNVPERLDKLMEWYDCGVKILNVSIEVTRYFRDLIPAEAIIIGTDANAYYYRHLYIKSVDEKVLFPSPASMNKKKFDIGNIVTADLRGITSIDEYQYVIGWVCYDEDISDDLSEENIINGVKNALQEADRLKIKSVHLLSPTISIGRLFFPIDSELPAKLLVAAIEEFLQDNPDTVLDKINILFDRDHDLPELFRKKLLAIQLGNNAPCVFTHRIPQLDDYHC